MNMNTLSTSLVRILLTKEKIKSDFLKPTVKHKRTN